MGCGEQVLTGLGFFGVGLYQALSLVRKHRKSGGKRLHLERSVKRLSLRLLDLYAVALLAGLHVLANLLPVYKLHTDGYSLGAAIRVERAAVAGVFLVYAVVAVVAEGTNFLPLPATVLKLMAVGVFVQEFLFFFFRSPDAGLEGQYHNLLLVPIGVCIFSTILELIYPTGFSPPLMRSLALMFQGTWFCQMAVSLFTGWISIGCGLEERSEGDYSVKCDGMHSMHRGKAIATLQFNLQTAALLLFSLPAYAVMCRVYSRPGHYEPLREDEAPDDARELFELKENGSRSFEVPSQSTYVLEDEEEEVQQEQQAREHGRKSSSDPNGFHTVII